MGSSVTLNTKSKFNRTTATKPVTVDYRDVNDNSIKFEGKTTANVEVAGTKQQLGLLITTKNTHPILGLDWMRKLGIKLESKVTTKLNHVNMPENTIDRRITALKRKFTRLFTENQTVKHRSRHTKKEGAKLIQQKGRPIPIHLQPAVEEEIEKLKRQGYIEKAKKQR